MKHRLHVPALRAQPDEPEDREIHIGAEQAHYLSRVLRLRVGARLRLFDGAGREWRSRLAEVDTRRALALVEALERSEPLPTALLLIQAWLKGSAMDMVVQKATELGATGIGLLASERSAVRHDPTRARRRVAHLEQVAIAATAQSERLWIPELEVFDSLSQLLSGSSPGPEAESNAVGAQPLALLRIMLDPQHPLLDAGDAPRPLQLLVGPEGGWSDAERALAGAAGVVSMGLGDLVLRAETAPLVALAAVRHGWGWRR